MKTKKFVCSQAFVNWLQTLPSPDRVFIDRLTPLFQRAFDAGAEALMRELTKDKLTADEPSKLPGSHPQHVCGLYCDGQDGKSSKCAQERRAAKLPAAVAAKAKRKKSK